jgi:ribonuclease-3
VDWPVVFRTHSEIEASIVRGLLETHGIDTDPSTGPASSTIFPFNAQGLVEVCIAVPPDLSAEATRIIAEHRDTVPNGVVVRLADAISGLERRIGYRFKDAGLLEHALTHKSRAHEDATGGVVDNESLEFLGDAVLGFVIADLLYHEFPHFQEGRSRRRKPHWSRPPRSRRWHSASALAITCCWDAGKKRPAAAPSWRSWPMAARPSSRPFIWTAEWSRHARSSCANCRRRSIACARRCSCATTSRRCRNVLQAEGRPLPEYDVAAERGPDHDKRFQVVVRVAGQVVA